MKKLLAIFLLTVYATTAFGVIINYHYCCGHLAHVSLLNLGGKSGCSCNPDAMPKGCCKDKLLYKKADNHNVDVSYSINTASFTPNIHPLIDQYELALLGGNYDADNFYNYLGRSCPLAIYLLIRVLRI